MNEVICVSIVSREYTENLPKVMIYQRFHAIKRKEFSVITDKCI